MKTLDEVIWAVENCDSAIDDCAHCAYYKEDCENLRPLRADALYYLKEYRKDKQIYSYDIARRNLEIAERNDPLSWDELKTMEGKPVWLEVKGYNGCWTIVNWNSNIVFLEFYDWIASPDDFMKAPLVSLDDTNFGTAWQAYRKERE